MPIKIENTWEEWEAGRARRRAICDQITGGRVMRRAEGDPRKDAILRQLNQGQRGLPFAELPVSRPTPRSRPRARP